MVDLLRISEILGYHEIQYPEFAITDYRQSVIEERLAELLVIDNALKEARLNSVADTIGDIRVQYSRHIQILKDEGSRLLREISSLSGIPLGYDRYSNRKQVLSFRSLYG